MTEIKQALEVTAGDDRRSIVPMTYNLAADTWGGWEDAETLDAADQAIGLESARLNIQLAEELGFPPERRKNGYWILGAHLLELGEYLEAESAFETSYEFALQTQDEAAQVMTQGWIITCQLLRGETTQLALEEIQGRLKTFGEDGEFYAGQFGPAIEKFAGREKK